jgi:hypothetical protein
VSEEEGARFESTGAGPGGATAARTCQWCGTAATSDATVCASCGAALAQRESIGDVAISGLTAVDAALQDYDKRPLHLRGPSPSQGLAPALIIGAVSGGPIGLAAIGGVAAVAAAEYLGARRPGDGAPLEDVGRPSEVVLQALDHLDANAAGASPPTPGAEPATAEAEPAADTPDDGRSIWRDLPPVAPAFQALASEERQEEGSADGR